jgi:hypothetical protein
MEAREIMARTAPLVVAPLGIAAVDRLGDYGAAGLGLGVLGLLGAGALAELGRRRRLSRSGQDGPRRAGSPRRRSR